MHELRLLCYEKKEKIYVCVGYVRMHGNKHLFFVNLDEDLNPIYIGNAFVCPNKLNKEIRRCRLKFVTGVPL